MSGTTERPTMGVRRRVSFAANGDPSAAAVSWPSVDDGAHVMSLVAPQPQVEADFVARHHCSFWLAG